MDATLSGDLVVGGTTVRLQQNFKSANLVQFILLHDSSQVAIIRNLQEKVQNVLVVQS
jgi:hypothetical protein